MEDIRGSGIKYIHALKNQIESLTEELIRLLQDNKEQHKTLSTVKGLLEQLCYRNGQQQAYTNITNTYNRKERYLDTKSEDNDIY